jgi:hypothetical protein
MRAVNIELVSKLGARLPQDGGLLKFGTTQDQALQQLERFGPTQTSSARAAPWTARVRIADRWIEAAAGPDALLTEIRVARAIDAPAWHEAPAIHTIHVLYRGIDVFDHPMAEIEFLLDAMEPSAGTGPGLGTSGSTSTSRERDLRLTGLSGYALSATLVAPSRRT